MSVNEIITVKVTLMAIPVFFIAIALEILAVRFFRQRGS